MAEDATTTDTTTVAEPTAPSTTTSTPKPDKGERTIPYARFEEVYQTMIDLRGEVAGLREVATERDKARAELATLQGQYTEDRALWGAGLTDPEGQDVARFLWSRVAEDARPEGGIGAWLSGLRADGATPPKALAPYLGSGTTPAAPVTPNPSRGVVPGPAPVGEVLSAEQIRAVTEKAQRTGDWSEYDRLRPSMMDAIRRK
ncbi:MAG: hypothetical protein H6733_10180 [Alphaproteobacteria bacterium]|nr:hypothetical protein [Alphaproteobacteria bacterium]